MGSYKSGQHLNSNILAVIDTETTGPVPGYNDIIEVACVILDKYLKPAKGITPFNIEIKPQRIENISLEALRIQGKDLEYVTKEKLIKNPDRLVRIATTGCDADVAADLFREWFEKLRLAPFKRIMPIACNWAFDREFLMDWLGRPGFDYIFDPRYRDVMSMTLYDNDIADWRCEEFEYPKNNLQYICTQLHIERTRQHNALDDVIVTAEAYRKLIQRSQIRDVPRSVDSPKETVPSV